MTVADVVWQLLTCYAIWRYGSRRQRFNIKKRKKRHKKLPDLNYLLEHFFYDPITGALLKKDGFEIHKGEQVGWQDKSGYWCVRILKQVYKLHRIVFYMYHRRDPGKKVIDHIDGDKSNNQIFNLRACSHRENSKNTKQQRDKGIIPKAERGAHLALA